MPAENDVLELIENTLYMQLEHVGPNVYSYDIEHVTPDLLPCVMVKVEGAQRNEASTTKNIYKFVSVNLDICTGRNNEFYNIKTLYDIREAISQKLEAATLPATITDFYEVGASELEANTDTESNILKQTSTYIFLTKETDH